jgi:hypothetical protein
MTMTLMTTVTAAAEVILIGQGLDWPARPGHWQAGRGTIPRRARRRRAGPGDDMTLF